MSVFGSTTKVPSKRQNDWQNSVCILKIKEFKIRDLLPRLGGMVGFSLDFFSRVICENKLIMTRSIPMRKLIMAT